MDVNRNGERLYSLYDISLMYRETERIVEVSQEGQSGLQSGRDEDSLEEKSVE